MKNIILGVLLLLVSGRLQAQGQYRFADFVNTANGFTATVEFRNRNLFSDPKVIGFNKVYLFANSAKVRAICPSFGADCDALSPTVTIRGSVQTNAIVNANNEGYHAITPQWYADSCAGNGCLYRTLESGQGSTWGCQIPDYGFSSLPGRPAEGYNGRTCDADGYDGWFRTVFTFTHCCSGQSLQFDESDLSVTFNEHISSLPSLTTAPEPSTWGMIGAGLLVIGASARRNRRTRYADQ